MSRCITLTLVLASILSSACSERTPAASARVVAFQNQVLLDRVVGGSDADEPRYTPKAIASDRSYGRSKENAVPLGELEAPNPYGRIRMFLNGIHGPQGQPIKYEAINGCCPAWSKELPNDLVVPMAVRLAGKEEPQVLYFAPFQQGSPVAPFGYVPR